MTDSRSELMALADCPIGLFYSMDGELCLKTEYGDNNGRIDAYIASSGEFFYGGAKTPGEQRQVFVRPVDLDEANSRLAASQPDREMVARAMALADSRKMILESSDATQLGHANDAGWREYLHMVNAILLLLVGGDQKTTQTTKPTSSRTEDSASETSDGAIYAAVSSASMTPKERSELDAAINNRIAKATYGGTPVYYLRSILRQMQEYRDFVGSCEVLTPSIGAEALADNIDWLDCFLDEHERATVANPDAVAPGDAGGGV